jgi:F0F1-type ATP synthase epsilon subunit
MSEKGHLQCVISSAEKTIIYEALESVTLPAFSGSMQILPGHAEAFVVIAGGNMILKHADGHIETLPIGASECHVENDQVMIIV